MNELREVIHGRPSVSVLFWPCQGVHCHQLLTDFPSLAGEMFLLVPEDGGPVQSISICSTAVVWFSGPDGDIDQSPTVVPVDFGGISLPPSNS